MYFGEGNLQPIRVDANGRIIRYEGSQPYTGSQPTRWDVHLLPPWGGNILTFSSEHYQPQYQSRAKQVLLNVEQLWSTFHRDRVNRLHYYYSQSTPYFNQLQQFAVKF